jgi:hypothetical protein
MAEGTVKSQLVALMKASAEEQRAFLTSLTDAQRAQSGMPDQWSAKDTVAHIAHSRTSFVEEYSMMLRGETPPDLPDADAQNKVIFLDHRNQTWPEVVTYADAAYSALSALLERYSEADLTTPDRLPPPRNNPLWRPFLGAGYTHPVLHFADYYLEHGDLERATTLQKRMAEGTASVGGERARGLADYNLACFYAKTGQPAPALALLPGALRLAPDIMEWSKEDPDLVSLHTEPAYQALYK